MSRRKYAVVSEELRASRALKIQRRVAGLPPSARQSYLRAVSGGTTTNAIKAFCMECVGYDRAEIEVCTSLACPLYLFRPFSV